VATKWLWRLHRLNIIDKHRLLLTVGSAFAAVDLGAEMMRLMRDAMRESMPDLPPISDLKLLVRPADRLFPLKVGDELYIGGVDHPVNPAMEFRFDVALGESGVVDGEPLIETLQQMVDAVDGLVAGFKPHLA
jgi:hypothetical protein